MFNTQITGFNQYF